jgi:hypothetical protein
MTGDAYADVMVGAQLFDDNPGGMRAGYFSITATMGPGRTCISASAALMAGLN